MKALAFVNLVFLRLLLAIGVIATVVDLIEFVQVMGMFGYDFSNPSSWLLVISGWFFGVNVSIGDISLAFPGVYPALILVAVSILAYDLALTRIQALPPIHAVTQLSD